MLGEWVRLRGGGKCETGDGDGGRGGRGDSEGGGRGDDSNVGETRVFEHL